MIFAQPRNIPLYCAQLLEGRLQERLLQEQAERREEQEVEVARWAVIGGDQVTWPPALLWLAREEFRRQQRQARASQQKRHSESQTGFTTDSGINSLSSYHFASVHFSTQGSRIHSLKYLQQPCKNNLTLHFAKFCVRESSIKHSLPLVCLFNSNK